MAQPSKNPSKSDLNRGITNSGIRTADERFLKDVEGRASFSEASLQREQLKKLTDIERIEAEERDLATATTIEQEQIENAQQLQRQQIAVRTAELRKKINLAKSRRTPGVSRFMGLSLLVTVGMLQIIWAVISATWFGIAIARDSVCSTAIISWGCKLLAGASSAIDYVTGLDLSIVVSFEVIGYAFWALILLITLCVVFCSLILFKLQKVPALESSVAKAGFVLSLALNLVPFLNIIPWIEIWAGVWIAKSAVSSVTNVPNLAKGS